MRGAEGARGDNGGAPTRQAGGAMDTGGLQRCRQGYGRHEGGELARQPRCAHSWGAEEQEMMDTMPASHLVSP